LRGLHALTHVDDDPADLPFGDLDQFLTKRLVWLRGIPGDEHAVV
jgi:hypothetical protein